MYGSAPPPQSETTVFQPRIPHAAAKVYAHWMTRIYREGYHLYAQGILPGPRLRRFTNASQLAARRT